MGLVGKFDNLCVLRSFSKSFSLAGLRIGYLAGPKALMEELMKAKDSYNVNRLSLAAAAAALDDYAYMAANVEKVIETRKNLIEQLDGLGFRTTPSQANFVWTKAPSPGAGAIYRALKEQKILVRHWERPSMKDYLRISVGTPEEIDTLMRALRQITGK